MVTITRGDGTPFDASSILEEDIIEICIRQAHIHPLGVLQCSMMESVGFHQNIEDLNHTLHTLPDMMEFLNEAITVWTMALAQAHVTAFIEMWCSNPTAGEGELHTPPYQTPPNEGTPHHIHVQLGGLNDSEL